jgi:uncharacterized protein YqfA (UPF0365 family)
MDDLLKILFIIGVGFGVLLTIIVLAVFAAYFKLWLRAFVTRARINPFSLLFMSLRKINPTAIVDAKINAVQAGLKEVTTDRLESHYLAGGNIRNVVRALIITHRAQIDLDWNTAAAIDLAGRNVLESSTVQIRSRLVETRWTA